MLEGLLKDPQQKVRTIFDEKTQSTTKFDHTSDALCL